MKLRANCAACQAISVLASRPVSQPAWSPRVAPALAGAVIVPCHLLTSPDAPGNAPLQAEAEARDQSFVQALLLAFFASQNRSLFAGEQPCLSIQFVGSSCWALFVFVWRACVLGMCVGHVCRACASAQAWAFVLAIEQLQSLPA